MSTRAIEDLAANLGEKIYIDVAKWHLYLADAKLHTEVAQKCFELVQANTITPAAVDQVLQGIAVPLGGGKIQVPLANLIPATLQATLLDILEECRQDL
jgi:hypothetical protein